VEAVRAGKLADADALMQEVVKANPASAKAQFVYADVLAREGKRDEARAALTNAETLEPALSFASPETVARVKDLIATAPAAAPAAEVAAPVAEAAPPVKKKSWLPPVVFFLGALVLGASVLNKRKGPAGSKAGPTFSSGLTTEACIASVRRMFGAA
jgi:hypothetical protein